MDYDLVVIGGGAGGMGSARASVRRGKRTVLIQDGPIGGDCTFTGCVPSKALISAAAKGLPFATAMRRARTATEIIAATEDTDVFGKEGIDVIDGRARFVAKDAVEVDGTRIEADRFVIATGGGPAVPPIPGLRELKHITSDDVWDMKDLPPRLAVLGGGAIGCELAQTFARLGSTVTIVEALDRLLAMEEPEASHVVETVFRREGVDVRTGQKVVGVEASGPDGKATITVEGGAAIECDAVLVAIGRRPVTEGLRPEQGGVEFDERGSFAPTTTCRRRRR